MEPKRNKDYPSKHLFVLKGKAVVPAESLAEWAEQFDGNREAFRRVALTKIGKITISTVFMGVDFTYGILKRKPILFETMIFGLPHNAPDTQRYETWEAAEEGHWKIVETVKSIRKVKPNGR